MRAGLRVALVGLGMALSGTAAHAQASSIPSAAPDAQQSAGTQQTDKGRALLDAMVKALGGDAWMNREDWIFHGREATFYKGQPHEGAPEFEDQE